MSSKLRILAIVGLASVTLVLLVTAGPARAQEGGSGIEIHGFGGWAYAETDGLVHVIGDSDGQYDNAELALNVAASPTERLSIVAQVFFESMSRGGEDEDDVELDYAFAEWFVNDALRLRVGRVKHPYGIYGEIFDVGTLRPFYLLPQSLYGPSGFTAKAYNGLGITGSRGWGSGWEIQYDLYGGEIEGDYEIPGMLGLLEEVFLEPRLDLGFTVEDTLGGRLDLATPVDGLRFGVSAYRGDERLGDETESREHTTYQLHGEYLSDRWTVRGEWGLLENEDVFEVEGTYLEVAYRLTEHWQLAVRGEDRETRYPNFDLSVISPLLTQVTDHQDLAFGINYWFNPSFVVRLNVHQTEGNRFAYLETPEQVAAALATGRLEDETELVILGAQFSF